MLFRGCGVAMVTPFSREGVDFPALGALIDRQIESETDALICLGTTGEPASLSPAEKDAILAFALEKSARRVPVIAGCGSNDTQTAVRQAIRCQELGADALLAVTPYYMRTSQTGLAEHYLRMADVCRVPLILYNVPSRTGVNLLPDTVARLSEHPMICGLKEAGSDLTQLAETVALVENRLVVYSGNDDTAVAAMALGAQGAISVTANVRPDLMRKMTHLALDGNFSGAREIHLALMPLMRALFCEPNPMPVKTALALLGSIEERFRPPLCAVSHIHRNMIKNALDV